LAGFGKNGQIFDLLEPKSSATLYYMDAAILFAIAECAGQLN